MVEPRTNYALAAACGTTEFGNFVSAGYMDLPKEQEDEKTSKDQKMVLVLARRYIDKQDARNAWVQTGAKCVLEELTKILSSSMEDAASLDPRAAGSQFWSKLLPRTK